MILVLASIVDQAAAAFADSFHDAAAVSLLQLRDLAEGVLELRQPGFQDSSLTVAGRVVPVAALAGVFNFLPAVFPDELVFYAPEERDYQASELHALLTFFLGGLACPVINRPTPAGLHGPVNTPLGWLPIAAGLGIPLAPLSVDSAAFTNPFVAAGGADAFQVSTLAGELLSPSGTVADEYTAALAKQAQVDYLRCDYRRGPDEAILFHGAHALPDLRDEATRQGFADLAMRLRRLA